VTGLHTNRFCDAGWIDLASLYRGRSGLTVSSRS